MELSLETEVLPKAVRDYQPEWGIVLGSGLAGLVEEVDAILSLPFEEISGMEAPTVPGHTGRFVFGKFAGTRVVIAQGRVHLYEGHSAEDVCSAIRFMGALGVRKLLLTNAAGAINPQFEPPSWMMISDHLNLTGTSPLLGSNRFIEMSAVYNSDLREKFHQAAQTAGIPLHEGVYAGVLGPQYETPAEIRMLKTIGADAVGMSTVLEAIQARALGIQVAAASCLTNWGAGLSPSAPDHSAILSEGKAMTGQLLRILQHALGP